MATSGTARRAAWARAAAGHLLLLTALSAGSGGRAAEGQAGEVVKAIEAQLPPQEKLTEAVVARIRGDAKRGDADARYILGMMRQVGRGVTKDRGEAAHWYYRAAELGHGGAAQLLGQLCLSAEYPFTRDANSDKLAHLWYTVSPSLLEARKAPPALLARCREVLKRLSATMTPRQIVYAKGLVVEWERTKTISLKYCSIDAMVRFFRAEGEGKARKKYYRSRFPKGGTGRVWCDVHVENPLHELCDGRYRLAWKCYGPDGRELKTMTKTWEARRTSGSGWVASPEGIAIDKGSPPGKYRVEVLVEGIKRVEREFLVVDGPVPSPYVVVNADNYEKEVTNAKSLVVIFHKFEDQMMTPCVRAEPDAYDVAVRYAGRARFVRISGYTRQGSTERREEVRKFLDFSRKLKIGRAPVFVFVRNGKRLGMTNGVCGQWERV